MNLPSWLSEEQSTGSIKRADKQYPHPGVDPTKAGGGIRELLPLPAALFELNELNGQLLADIKETTKGKGDWPLSQEKHTAFIKAITDYIHGVRAIAYGTQPQDQKTDRAEVIADLPDVKEQFMDNVVRPFTTATEIINQYVKHDHPEYESMRRTLWRIYQVLMLLYQGHYGVVSPT